MSDMRWWKTWRQILTTWAKHCYALRKVFPPNAVPLFLHDGIVEHSATGHRWLAGRTVATDPDACVGERRSSAEVSPFANGLSASPENLRVFRGSLSACSERYRRCSHQTRRKKSQHE